MAYPPSQRSPSFDWPLDGWKIGVAVLLFAGLAIWWWRGIEMPVAEETDISLPLATSQAYSFGANPPSEPGEAQIAAVAEPSLALTVVALVSAVAATPSPAVITPTPALDAATITPTATPLSRAIGLSTAIPSPTLTLAPLTPTSTITPTATPSAPAFEVLGAADVPLTNSRPALYGTTTPGAILLIDVGEKRYFVEADASGEWIFVSPAPLPAGTTTVRIGRPGPGGRGERDMQSLVVQIAEDAQPIPPPTLDPLAETLMALPTLTGRASVGSTVQIYARRQPDTEPLLLGETVTDEDGQWATEAEFPPTPDDYAIWVVLVDGEGRPISRSATTRGTIAASQP